MGCMAASTESVEEAVRRSFDGGDMRAATTILLESYGPQILGFLMSRLSEEAAAQEVFSSFCEDVWRGLPGFEWRCTARAWAYTLARHAESRYRMSPHRWREVPVSMTDVSEARVLADRVRTTTLPHLRSEVKDRFRALRERLSEEEQLILVLRVDKNMAWTEIAHVLRPEDSASPSSKEVATLRKRFQLIKEKLRRLAEDEGVIPMG
jgi:RNA polymerase sigma-70 factor, ECF subfamily